VCFGNQCTFLSSPQGSACNDGVFCNGQEYCDEYANCSPVSLTALDGQSCPCSSSEGFFASCTCLHGVCGFHSLDIGHVLAVVIPVAVVVIGLALVGAIFLSRRYYSKPSGYAIIKDITDSSNYLQNVEIQDLLGEGSFGRVFRGSWEKTTIALKELKDNSHIQEFLEEAKLLQSLRHPHIVNFYGIHAHQQHAYLVIEFMDQGSLSDYLQFKRNQLQSTDLLKVVLHTLQGMAYLEHNKIIHRDLAARNLLVSSSTTSDFIVKVSDFGLGKVLQSNTYYAKDIKFPVKWSSPEVIQYQKYSLASDVWSFGKSSSISLFHFILFYYFIYCKTGVVIWEIYSFGKTPYPGMTNVEAIEKVTHGYRMPVPDNCPKEIAVWMEMCWNEKPENRPIFSTILKELTEFFIQNNLKIQQSQPPSQMQTQNLLKGAINNDNNAPPLEQVYLN
jgi:serine/threonine protein kinase